MVVNPGQSHPGLGPAFGSGSGLIITCTVSEFVQELASVTITTYPVVVDVVETGFEHVVQLNPVEGLHKKVPLPVAVSVVEAPMHIATSDPALTAGLGRIFIETKSVSVQLFSETISV